MSNIPKKLYLLLIFISVFNTEIIVGSTNIVQFATPNPLAWSSLPFYGLLLLLYIDLADRFHMDGIEIFLLGMMHGIFEEGISLWTFFFKHPSLPSSYNLGTVLGIHTNWAIVVTFGESILLVVLGIMFARIIVPYQVRQGYLLSKRGVILSVCIVAIISLLYNLLGFYIYQGVPSLLSYLVTWGLLLFIGFMILAYRRWIKIPLHQWFSPKISYRLWRYVLSTFLVIVAFTIMGFTTQGYKPLYIKLIAICTAFLTSGLLLCSTAWSDSAFSPKKHAAVFITLLVLFTLIFIPLRSLPSTIAMVIVAAFEILLVIKGVKRGGVL